MNPEPVLIPDVVSLFPLPEVVLFPRTLVPLHIFEPRYREMTADALVSDRILATALLKPGYAPLYYTRRAPIHDTVVVGQIVESEQVEEGNFNLLLRGLGRARILEEVGQRTYRQARIELVETFCYAETDACDALRDDLLTTIRENPGLDPQLRRHWLKLAELDVDLDTLCDLIAAGTPIESELRQGLLEEPDAFARTQLLRDHLRTVAAVAQNYLRRLRPGPPDLN